MPMHSEIKKKIENKRESRKRKAEKNQKEKKQSKGNNKFLKQETVRKIPEENT